MIFQVESIPQNRDFERSKLFGMNPLPKVQISYFYDMLRFLFLGSILLLLSAACTKGHGNKLESDRLDIYFEFKEDEERAAAIGKFWKDNELLGDQKQTLRLTKDDKTYLLQLIAADKKEVKNMPFSELKLLLDFQKSINEAIFMDSKPCEILLCDGSFQVLININEL